MKSRHLPPLHAIRAFEAAARHLSMTRAAKELSVTPGAISRHIRSLQNSLNESLIIRESNGLRLTPAGEALAAASRDGLDCIAEAITGLKSRRQRRLSIGTYGYFASKVLLPHLGELEKGPNGLTVDIHTSLNPLDLSPTYFDAVVTVTDKTNIPGLVSIPLIPISTIPVCSKSLLAGGKLNFGNTRLLHSRPRPDDWPRWLEYAKVSQVPVSQSGCTFETTGLALQAASMGLGAAIAIEALIQDSFASGELVPAHDQVRATRHSFTLIFDKRHSRDPKIGQFQEWLLDISHSLLTMK